MRTERDMTYTEERVPPEVETFMPKRPDPSGWKIQKPQYTMTTKDQVALFVVVACIVLTSLLTTVFFAVTSDTWTSPQAPNTNEQDTQTSTPTVNAPSLSKGAFADGAEGEVLFGTSDSFKKISQNDFMATYAAVANVKEGKLVAGIGEDTRIYPASLTKVMTLITIGEYLKDEAALQDKITMSKDVFEAMYAAGSSGQGFEAGETLTVEALLYALMLQSDGYAACELARYIAGSEAAFVALMNEKASDMGLTNTHFVNPTGLHDENHYSSCRDLATIMGYAMNMSLCRKIMTEDRFDAVCLSPTAGAYNHQIYHNLMVTYFNMYDDLTPDKAGQMTILAGKTGYTPEAGICLVTCVQGADGTYYVCVTTGAESYKDCIKSYQSLYSKYVG